MKQGKGLNTHTVGGGSITNFSFPQGTVFMVAQTAAALCKLFELQTLKAN